MALEPAPIPAALMAPPGAEQWMDQLLDYAASLADEAAMDPADVGTNLAVYPDEHPTVPEQVRRWTVDGYGTAEWAMARCVEADQQLGALREQAVEWADRIEQRIEQWFAHAAARPQATLAFMGAHLQRYALELREDDPKAKTLVLPSGVVKTTSSGPKAVVEDEAAVVAWAYTQSDAVLAEVAPKQPRKLCVTPLRDHTEVVEVIDHAKLLLANTGEVVEWTPTVTYHGDARETRTRCPQPGDGWPTPDTATDLVARVEVLASHAEVHGPDGLPVPGTTVAPATVTAKVVPAP